MEVMFTLKSDSVLISSVELEDSQLSTPALEKFREDKLAHG